MSVVYRGKTPFKTCDVCGFYYRTKTSHLQRRKTCSAECNYFKRKTMYKGNKNPNYGNRGERNPLFKTGVRMTRYGYRMVYKPSMPNSQADGYILEHRYVMSIHIQRPLRDEEHIHHIDGDKLNNDINNLEIISLEEHSRMHSKETYKNLGRDSLGRFRKAEKKGG